MQYLVLLLFVVMPVAAHACPDLTPYYPGDNPDWPTLEREMAGLMPQCLENGEYFALFGAAQLNSGSIDAASESLERALLLQPDHGGAQIDYAEALYLQGQLFSALEMNRQLLARDDLPADLQPLIRQRQRNWQGQTRQRGFQADLLAGYDDNLNGAPDPDTITLTLSGEPVLLELNPEYRPISGPYLNLRMAARYRQLAPQHQHNWLVEARGRISEDTESDLVQLGGQYAFIRPGRRHSWQLNTGVNHLAFGGNPLFTAVDARTRFQPRSGRTCRPYLGLAAQHQHFHHQRNLNALESKASAGLTCPFNNGMGSQLLSAEFSLLNNAALNNGRAGGSRDGWQVNADWQMTLSGGVLLTQLSHTELDDRDGYSPLLADGAERWLTRSYALIQYRWPVSSRTDLLVNFYHQYQRSNIELFQSTDTSVELGFGFSF
ncbi:MAG: tetratricopeptide repeat protein [Pseudohongiellaceae bacterium]